MVCEYHHTVLFVLATHSIFFKEKKYSLLIALIISLSWAIWVYMLGKDEYRISYNTCGNLFLVCGWLICINESLNYLFYQVYLFFFSQVSLDWGYREPQVGWVCLQLSHIILTLGLEFIDGYHADNHSRFIIFLNNYPSAQWCCLSSFRMLVQEIHRRGSCHLNDETNDGKFTRVEG